MTQANQALDRVPGVAKFLGVSERTVYRLVAAGELPVYRVGRQLRFDEQELRQQFRRTVDAA